MTGNFAYLLFLFLTFHLHLKLSFTQDSMVAMAIPYETSEVIFNWLEGN